MNIMKYIKKLIIYTNKYVSRNRTINYSRFWNFIFIVTNNPVRINPTENENKILITDNEHSIYISQKIRAWFYFKSINNRFESLSKMYFFDKIIFGDDDIIIDCGANIGEIYHSVKSINSNNFYYYGFEPVPSEFELVQLNTINQISRPLALFDKNEQRRLYVHKAGADSTLLQDDRYEDGGMIECIRLDSLSQLNGKKIKLLKLEAEGAELEVLIGCGEILPNIEYISADIGFELDQGRKSNHEEVTAYLEKNNFYKVSFNSRYINLFKNKNF